MDSRAGRGARGQSSGRGGGGRGRGGRRGGGGGSGGDVKLSKALSYVLRHGAAKAGVTMRPDGYVRIAELLNKSQFKPYTLDDVLRVVAENDKQRFALQEGKWEETAVGEELLIRANQGHSVEVEQLELERINRPEDLPVALHGTYQDAWNTIATKGLSRMKRNHIHLACGAFGEVQSGVRGNCQVYVYVDVARAMAEGVEFLRSANGVVLTEGLDGMIPPRLFERAVRLSDGTELAFERTDAER